MEIPGMKTFARQLLMLSLLTGVNAFAQVNPEGTWQGQLETAPGTEMTVQFIISAEADGSYSALINSPDSGALKNVAADSITVADNELTMEFDSLSGEFSGTLSQGELAGEWRQLDQSFPLIMTAYEKPTMSAADLEYITGSWVGKLEVTGIELPVVFRFEANEAGDLVGEFDSPLEGAFGLPVDNLSFADSKLDLSLDFAGVRFTGEASESGIDGVWRQSGQEFALGLSKGEYETDSSKLEIDEAARERLEGSWSGQLGPITMVIRFEYDDEDNFVAFVDSPDQNVNGLVVTAMSLEDNALSLQLTVPPAEYNGELIGDEIVGEWSQGGMNNPLTLTRD